MITSSRSSKNVPLQLWIWPIRVLSLSRLGRVRMNAVSSQGFSKEDRHRLFLLDASLPDPLESNLSIVISVCLSISHVFVRHDDRRNSPGRTGHGLGFERYQRQTDLCGFKPNRCGFARISLDRCDAVDQLGWMRQLRKKELLPASRFEIGASDRIFQPRGETREVGGTDA